MFQTLSLTGELKSVKITCTLVDGKYLLKLRDLFIDFFTYDTKKADMFIRDNKGACLEIPDEDKIPEDLYRATYIYNHLPPYYITTELFSGPFYEMLEYYDIKYANYVIKALMSNEPLPRHILVLPHVMSLL